MLRRDAYSKKVSYEKVLNAALELFGHDKDKAIRWWMTKNPQLDDLSPFEMVKSGHGRRVIRLIEFAMRLES